MAPTTRRRRAAGPAAPPGVKVQKVGQSQKASFLIFSHPGVGKTSFIATWPRPERVLIIRPPMDHTTSIKNSGVQEVVVTSWLEMNAIEDALRERGSEWVAGFDWVWLDSISLFQDTGLDDIWTDVVAKRPARAEYGLDKGEYGVNMFRLQRWIRNTAFYTDRPFHFGVTAHASILPDPDADSEDDEDKTILMPWIQGKNMAPKICGYMNFVGYMRVARVGTDKKKARVLHTDASDRWYGKNQYKPVANDRIVNPTLPKVFTAFDIEED